LNPATQQIQKVPSRRAIVLSGLTGNIFSSALGGLVANVLAVRPEARVFENEAPVELAHVSDFWSETARENSLANQRIRISGALSTYAPLVPGDPRWKHLVHRQLRKGINSLDAWDVNALMALSAGQLIVRVTSALASDRIYMGLYHSIVRNSIPVLVDSSYFEKIVRPHFESANVMEVELIGTVISLGDTLSDLVDHVPALRHMKSKIKHEKPKTMYAIQIGGKGTGIRVSKKEPRYLDGDIWIVVKKGSHETLWTAFTDITRPDHVRDELRMLEKEAGALGSRASIVAQFDDVNIEES